MGGSSCKPRLDPKKHHYNFDLIVIGGGSAGIACARDASKLGAIVALCDYVTPSPKGSTWGLGGTCVNVGCIPKRIMHQSNVIKDSINDATLYGWTSSDTSKVKWETLVENVQDYVSSLNFGYKMVLGQLKITYFKGLASFKDEHHVQIVLPNDELQTISAQHIVIAVGGRPNYLKIPGGTPKDNLCITSDDIFSLSYPPGKTLCVGAGYISVECAGFLAGFGFDVTLMARSVVLKDFDAKTVELMTSNLQGRLVTIVTNAEPTKITLVKDGTPPTLKVSYLVKGEKVEREEEFNTVLLAVGRSPVTEALNLKLLPKIKVDSEGYIETDKNERTGVPNIFAVGDCAKNRPKLTPAACRGGSWLARRLFEKNFSKPVNYDDVPTTIFTPIEYGICGISEESAISKYGDPKVEVYHKQMTPLEFALNRRDVEASYSKIICVKSGKKEKIVGLHYLGPYAGEVIGGFALAVKQKLTKDELNNLIGIHPTCGEIFTDMTVTKRSEASAKQEQC